jgi:hypothetical protein
VDYSDLHKQLDTVIEERDNYQKEIEIIKRHNSDDHGRDRIVVGFITIYAISAYHH